MLNQRAAGVAITLIAMIFIVIISLYGVVTAKNQICHSVTTGTIDKCARTGGFDR